jgi:hypothetical protein
VLRDLAPELVPVDDGLVRAREAVVAAALGHLGPLVGAGARVQVGAADPAPQHAQAYLPAGRDRFGQLVDPELGVLADDGLHPAVIVMERPA